MQKMKSYLIIFVVSAFFSDLCYSAIYCLKWFGDDLSNLPNQILYRLHILFLGLALIGMLKMYSHAQSASA